jgi:hypothetical protein
MLTIFLKLYQKGPLNLFYSSQGEKEFAVGNNKSNTWSGLKDDAKFYITVYTGAGDGGKTVEGSGRFRTLEEKYKNKSINFYL